MGLNGSSSPRISFLRPLSLRKARWLSYRAVSEGHFQKRTKTPNFGGFLLKFQTFPDRTFSGVANFIKPTLYTVKLKTWPLNI